MSTDDLDVSGMLDRIEAIATPEEFARVLEAVQQILRSYLVELTAIDNAP